MCTVAEFVCPWCTYVTMKCAPDSRLHHPAQFEKSEQFNIRSTLELDNLSFHLDIQMGSSGTVRITTIHGFANQDS